VYKLSVWRGGDILTVPHARLPGLPPLLAATHALVAVVFAPQDRD